MKKSATVILTAAAVAAMAALAWYGLTDSQQSVTEKPYGGGDFVYSGALLGGRFDYRGTAVFADSASLKGYFSKGRVFAGTYSSADGWRFEGQFREGRLSGAFFLPEGLIVSVSEEDVAGLDSPRGWVYYGGIGERGQNGEGSFTFPGGESYTGAFLLGLADGHGVYRGADGNILYEGEWKAGLYHGEGRCTAPDGAFAYAGAFESGLPHGEAAYWEGSDLRYKGDFVGGVPEGQGTYASAEGWIYEGGFKNGVFHGPGAITKAGIAQKGTWDRGRQVSREQ